MNECASISSNDEDDEVNADGINDVDEDDVEDEANQLNDDGLSDFDNFSGRDTPIISGRDTPSSHSHEDLQNISGTRQANTPGTGVGTGSGGIVGVGAGSVGGGGVGGGSGGGPNVRGGGGGGGLNSSGIATVGLNSSSSNAAIPRGPQLPVTVQKSNREDINDKFGKFEINKSR